MSTQPDSTPQATAGALDKGVGCDALLACPWCGENDFDTVGLKLHIACGRCDEYNNTSISLPRSVVVEQANNKGSRAEERE